MVICDSLSKEGKTSFHSYRKLENRLEIFTAAMVAYYDFIVLAQHIEDEYNEPAYKKRREEDVFRASGQKECYKEYYKLFKEIEEETADTFKAFESETDETQLEMVNNCISPYAQVLFEGWGKLSEEDEKNIPEEKLEAEKKRQREFEEKKKAFEEREAKALDQQKQEYQKVWEASEVVFPTADESSSEEIKAPQAANKKAPKLTRRRINAD